MACSESDAAPEGRSADDRTAALIRAAITGRDLPEPSGKPCAGISGVLVGTRAKCVWNHGRTWSSLAQTQPVLPVYLSGNLPATRAADFRQPRMSQWRRFAS